MTSRNGERAASRKATRSELRLATHSENRRDPAKTQPADDRSFEREARRCAVLALGLGGGLSFQQVALSRFYATRAAALTQGGAV